VTSRFEHLEFDERPLRFEEQEHEQQAGQSSGVLGAEPMHRHAYHQRAIEFLHRGDFEQALRAFTRTLELDRSFVPAWVGQVQMLVELEELREAELWADKALDLFKDNGDLLSARAVAVVRRADRHGALRCSDAGLAARGVSAYRWVARGEVLLAWGSDQVQSCFDRALLEQDADWFTGLSIARTYRRYQRFTNALAAARKATEQAPHAPFAWYIRGLCERDLAIGAAVTSFNRTLELDATFKPARDALRMPTTSSWVKRLLRRARGA
jgi:tetratricopeptide (TPR) repeat protein